MSTTTLPSERRSWRVQVRNTIDTTTLLLGYVTLLGLIAALWRLATGLGSSTGLTNDTPWGIWIGFDFSLIALSGAGFTMAGLVYVLRREELRPALRPAVLTALLGYTAVLGLLVLDLGRPDRFYHFLIFWNLHSPLFEISWCVLLYSTVLAIEVSPQLLEKIGRQRAAHLVHRIIVPVAIAAVTLSTLHQSTLGTLYLNMPYRLHALWFTPILPVLFLVSSIFTGLAMAAAAYAIAARVVKEDVQPNVLGRLTQYAGWVGILYLVLKFGDIAVAGELAALFAFDAMSVRMWIELALVIVPAVLFLAPSLRSLPRYRGLGVALLLAGTVVNRFNATIFAQTFPVETPYTPSGVEWVTTIGIVGAAMLAWYLGVQTLAVFERLTGKH